MVASWNRDVRVTRHRRKIRCATTTARITIHEIDERRRSLRWNDYRIQFVLRDGSIDSFGARFGVTGCECIDVLLVRQRTAGLGRLENLLTKIRHLLTSVRVVERNQIGEALHRRTCAE